MNNTTSEPTVPAAINECHAFLLKKLSKEDLSAIKNCAFNKLCQWHFSFGRWIRNNWGLWAGGELKTHMESLGFTHPDDMSTVILESFWSNLNEQPYDLEEAANSYKEYWKMANNNCKMIELTGP